MAATFWEKVRSAQKEGYTPDEIIDGIAAQYPEIQETVDKQRIIRKSPADILSRIEQVVGTGLKSGADIEKESYQKGYETTGTGEKRGAISKGMVYAGAPLSNLYAGLRQAAGGEAESEAGGKQYLASLPGGELALAAGTIGSTAPLALAPGGILTAMGTAGAMGAAEPVAKADMAGGSQYGARATRGIMDALTSGATFGASKAIPAVYRGVIEPYTERGQQQVVKRGIERLISESGGTADDLARAVQAAENPVILPGSMPTTAQATLNPALGRLEKAYAGRIDSAGEFANRAAEQNLARQGALTKAFGTADDVVAAEAARKAATEPLYSKAGKLDISSKTVGMPAMMELGDLVGTGPGNKIFEAARTSAEVRGIPFMTRLGLTGEGLQLVKEAADEAAEKAARGASDIGQADAEYIAKGVKSWGEKHIPEWGAAKQAYAEASTPISRMKVGQELQRGASGTVEMVTPGGDAARALLPAQVARMTADTTAERRLTERVLGKRYGKEFGELFTPEQLGTLDAVKRDLARQSTAAARSASKGSDTRDNMLTEQFLAEIKGSLGPLEKIELVKGAIGSISGALSKAIEAGGAGKQIDAAVKNILLNPDAFAKVVRSNPALGAKIADSLGRAGAAGASTGTTQTVISQPFGGGQ